MQIQVSQNSANTRYLAGYNLVSSDLRVELMSRLL